MSLQYPLYAVLEADGTNAVVLPASMTTTSLQAGLTTVIVLNSLNTVAVDSSTSTALTESYPAAPIAFLP